MREQMQTSRRQSGMPSYRTGPADRAEDDAHPGAPGTICLWHDRCWASPADALTRVIGRTPRIASTLQRPARGLARTCASAAAASSVAIVPWESRCPVTGVQTEQRRLASDHAASRAVGCRTWQEATKAVTRIAARRSVMRRSPRPMPVAFLSLLALGLLWTVGHAPEPSRLAARAVGTAAARRAPDAQPEPEALALGAQVLTPPPARVAPLPAWSPPALETVLGRLKSDPELPAAASRALFRDVDVRRPAGSYATLRPNRIGAPANRLWGSLNVHFGYGFPMDLQHDGNFALVQVPSSQHPLPCGTFLVKSGSASAWYLLTLHLTNPFDQRIVVSSSLKVLGTPGTPHYSTQTVAPRAGFTVQRVFSARDESTKAVAWLLRETNSASPCVALRAVTVDRLGS